MKDKGDKLIGVKAIADYLKVTERTVYRWEKKLGLPLSRINGNEGYSVFAFTKELDRFQEKNNNLEKNPERVNLKLFSLSLKFRRSTLLISGVFAVLLLVVTIVVQTDPFEFKSPVSLSYEGNQVSVLNKYGLPIWSYGFQQWDHDPTQAKFSRLLDVDNDGRNELFTFQYPSEADGFKFVMYEDDGKMVWPRYPEVKQSFGGVRYTQQFQPRIFDLYQDDDGEMFLYVSWCHKDRFPGVFEAYDVHGNVIGSYIHSGTVGDFVIFDVKSDGTDELIVSFINNLLNNEITLAVLPQKGFRGTAPPYRIEPEYENESEYLKTYLPDDPLPGNQISYLRFSIPDFRRDLQIQYPGFRWGVVEDDFFEVSIVYWSFDDSGIEKSLGVMYQFDNQLALHNVTPTTNTIDYLPLFPSGSEGGLTIEEFNRHMETTVIVWNDGEWLPVERTNSNKQ